MTKNLLNTFNFMASYEKLETPIVGLEILLNKVVSDERGHFLDLAETDNPSMASGYTKHLHASIATTKHIARAEHYHHKIKESFYTLAGTALWIFSDFNKNSPTYGKTYAAIAGNGKAKPETSLPTFYLDEGKFPQFKIDIEIYHAFWPLTDEPAIIMATGTDGYDPDDYERPAVEEVPGARKILEEHGINTH